MNIEGPSSTHERGLEGFEQVSRAVRRFEELESSAVEATGILYQDREPRFPEERVMAERELIAESCTQEAEACADRGERKGERAERILEEVARLETKLQGLYFDAQLDDDFSSLAELIKKRHPGVASNSDTFQEGEVA